jgi:hypothetical protein
MCEVLSRVSTNNSCNIGYRSDSLHACTNVSMHLPSSCSNYCLNTATGGAAFQQPSSANSIFFNRSRSSNQLISILQYQYEQMTTFCRTESCKRYNDSRTFKNMAIIHTLCRENMFASIVQESTKYELQSWYVLLLQKKNAVTHLCVTVISLQKLITPYVTNKCITKNNMRKVGSG